MRNVNDYIIYKRDVCKIKEIKKNFYKGLDYICAFPVYDESLIINIPSNSPAIRDMLSREEAMELVDMIPSIEPIAVSTKSLEGIYKELLASNLDSDLVKIIKTTYRRNKRRVEDGKKIGDRDDMYFKLAEKFLYNMLAIPLGMSYDEVKSFIEKKVGDLHEENK